MASPTSNIVLVTGGNQGIGFAIAKKLATDYSDYHIIIGSRDASRGVEAASSLSNQGFSVSSIQLDVTDDTSIASARQKIEARHQRIDVLINNAGIAIDSEPGDLTKFLRWHFRQTLLANMKGNGEPIFVRFS